VYSTYHVTFLESHDGHPSTFNPEVEELPPLGNDILQNQSIQEITQSSFSTPLFNDDDEIFVPVQLEVRNAEQQAPANAAQANPTPPIPLSQPPAP
jgi:hypothetical protein